MYQSHLGCLQEYAFRNMSYPTKGDTHGDTWEDVSVVALAGVEGFVVVLDRVEGTPACKYTPTLQTRVTPFHSQMDFDNFLVFI